MLLEGIAEELRECKKCFCSFESGYVNSRLQRLQYNDGNTLDKPFLVIQLIAHCLEDLEYARNKLINNFLCKVLTANSTTNSRETTARMHTLALLY